jgi:menaquinone-9 beta-reductase
VDDHHDVIVVGARVAGATTALLLARAGYDVLVVDRARRGSDTLSTHALMRPAVMQLERWGVLADLVAAGTPGQDRVVFHYGDEPLRIDLTRRLYAPRRTVIDPILVDAAERSGARFEFGISVEDLLRDPSGRVVGVCGRGSGRTPFAATARVVVGADGRGSRVAACVDPFVTRRGSAASGFVFGYWQGVEAEGYEWCFRPGTSAGLIPTNDGQTCVFAGVPADRFTTVIQPDLEAGLRRVLHRTNPRIAERVEAGTQVGRIRGFPGIRGWLRRPHGAGWALVGDAGYYKDPTTAHGMTDAFRDAELLARALDRCLSGTERWSAALADYEALRDQLSIPLFEATDAIAAFRWDLDEVQQHHLTMSAAIDDEVETLALLAPTRLRGAPAA